MRNDVFMRSLVFGLVASFGLASCAAEAEIPPFPEGSGQSPRGSTQVAYPNGPYGIAEGSIIPNYEFVGFANAAVNTDGMQLVQLADFYNPTGDGVYPKGSPYGENLKKPKALLVILSAVWCAPCNQEADTVLPPLHEKYRPQGGEFFLALADGPNQGVPAEPKNLYLWTQKYDVDFPSVIDPGGKIPAITEADAFPANVMIRTKDMKIIRAITGSPDATDWKIYEKIIADALP